VTDDPNGSTRGGWLTPLGFMVIVLATEAAVVLVLVTAIWMVVQSHIPVR
jgi:hypothetical protein